jgi:acyl-CoA oxidase
LGAYAQTELGHGSDVAGLETTATFDQKTDEFVIHTPSITAAKYWPGEMGRYTTHAVAMARLKIGKKDYGVHPFIVQLRDMNTFKHMAGVETGDLGPKFAFHNKDNGWATFD